MADLEEKILMRNVPGRVGDWKDEDDDVRGDDADAFHDQGRDVARAAGRERGQGGDDGDDEDDDGDGAGEAGMIPGATTEEMRLLEEKRKMTEEGIPEPMIRQILMERAAGHQTGPKGVLADYRQHKQIEEIRRQMDAAHRDAVLKRMTEGAVEPAAAPDGVVPLLEHLRRQATAEQADAAAAATRHAKQRDGEGDGGSGGDEDEFDEDDDDFMRGYRQRRLRELQASAHRPTFGDFEILHPFAFLDAIDKEDPRVVVVVHMFDNSVRACVTLNKMMPQLARRHVKVKFRALLACEAMPDFDLVALPILTVYRGGELTQCLTRITDELGENLVIEDVDWLLESNDVYEDVQRPPPTQSGS